MTVIAVDFDGTLCQNAWPEIGTPNQAVIDACKQCRTNGTKLILWTCREGERLSESVEWCKERGLEFDAVNENLPELIELYGNDCRKIGADWYLDDKNITVAQIAALREQAERQRGCVWCKEDNKVFHDGQHYHMFCSYCGKRLEVEL